MFVFAFVPSRGIVQLQLCLAVREQTAERGKPMSGSTIIYCTCTSSSGYANLVKTSNGAANILAPHIDVSAVPSGVQPVGQPDHQGSARAAACGDRVDDWAPAFRGWLGQGGCGEVSE